MKVRAYIRVAKTKRKFKVAASERPTAEPLEDRSCNPISYHPTIYFALDISLPDDAFDYAEKLVGEVDYRKQEFAVAGDMDKKIVLEIKKQSVKDLGKL